ncbi:MAG TPA: hypothetical protein PK513_05975 [Alphaproteobacteria bacterium]|nr:hypothetical protein [Alphaproteobacteria bacterium]USO05859.1 MAG: hypothetical protein H6859_01250 [Rhodospirillales bacterium]HOO82029.1 hypothetical protein [Alphaproteobacteria bacterium]
MNIVTAKEPRKPVQAGDYGKHAELPTKDEAPKPPQNTDGRKTLALWS